MTEMHFVSTFIQRNYNTVTFSDCTIVLELNLPPFLCACCMKPGKSHRLRLENLKRRGLKAPFFSEAFSLICTGNECGSLWIMSLIFHLNLYHCLCAFCVWVCAALHAHVRYITDLWLSHLCSFPFNSQKSCKNLFKPLLLRMLQLLFN